MLTVLLVIHDAKLMLGHRELRFLKQRYVVADIRSHPHDQSPDEGQGQHLAHAIPANMVPVNLGLVMGILLFLGHVFELLHGVSAALNGPFVLGIVEVSSVQKLLEVLHLVYL
jgi:hypothetical protein